MMEKWSRRQIDVNRPDAGHFPGFVGPRLPGGLDFDQFATNMVSINGAGSPGRKPGARGLVLDRADPGWDRRVSGAIFASDRAGRWPGTGPVRVPTLESIRPMRPFDLVPMRVARGVVGGFAAALALS